MKNSKIALCRQWPYLYVISDVIRQFLAIPNKAFCYEVFRQIVWLSKHYIYFDRMYSLYAVSSLLINSSSLLFNLFSFDCLPISAINQRPYLGTLEVAENFLQGGDRSQLLENHPLFWKWKSMAFFPNFRHILQRGPLKTRTYDELMNWNFPR